jgi:hypothetical protein
MKKEEAQREAPFRAAARHTHYMISRAVKYKTARGNSIIIYDFLVVWRERLA